MMHLFMAHELTTGAKWARVKQEQQDVFQQGILSLCQGHPWL
jgi:hypothetical protein